MFIFERERDTESKAAPGSKLSTESLTPGPNSWTVRYELSQSQILNWQILNWGTQAPLNIRRFLLKLYVYDLQNMVFSQSRFFGPEP